MPNASPSRPRRPCRLWAISDIHLSYKENREALEELLPYPNDDLILCGDVGETVEHCRIAFAKTTRCFRQVYWAPGNHELYTISSQTGGDAKGDEKYMACVEVAREFGVRTPEDEYTLWEGEEGPRLIATNFYTV